MEQYENHLLSCNTDEYPLSGYGIHMEKRPHRFDRLRKENYKEWHFWMYDMGWGKVLDYIGVPWEDEVQEYEQTLLPDFLNYVWEDIK